MKVLALVLTAASVVISVPALAQEPPPPEAAPPPAAPPPPPPAAYAPPAPAAAPMDAGRFGGAGQFVVSVDLPFTNSAPQFAIVHETQSMSGPSATVFEIAPSLDYVVAPNLTIGATLGVARLSESLNGSDFTVTSVTVVARVGYNVPFSDAVSIWPRAGFAYAHSSSDSGGASASSSQTALVLEAPILIHPASHFFLGAGPIFQTQLSSSAESGGISQDQPKNTDVGVSAMVGGYFGGM
jgi:Outer membrane protein beta-barrel domain